MIEFSIIMMLCRSDRPRHSFRVLFIQFLGDYDSGNGQPRFKQPIEGVWSVY